MLNNEYDELLTVIIDEAKSVIDENEFILKNEDRFHDVLFGRVLTVVDEDGSLSHLEAREISEVCGEVESDIIHGDILGL